MPIEFRLADKLLLVQIRIAFELGFALFVFGPGRGLLGFCATCVEILIFGIKPRERISLGYDAPYLDITGHDLAGHPKAQIALVTGPDLSGIRNIIRAAPRTDSYGTDKAGFGGCLLLFAAPANDRNERYDVQNGRCMRAPK